MMPPELKTVREWLAPMGLDRVEVRRDEAEWILGTLAEAPRFASSEGTGLIQGLCSGECVLYLSPWATDERGCRFPANRPIYVVRDDQAGEAWDAEWRRPGAARACPPRPFAKLKLVRGG